MRKLPLTRAFDQRPQKEIVHEGSVRSIDELKETIILLEEIDYRLASISCDLGLAQRIRERINSLKDLL